jgi:uncharacterized protein (TIGR02145 family)
MNHRPGISRLLSLALFLHACSGTVSVPPGSPTPAATATAVPTGKPALSLSTAAVTEVDYTTATSGGEVTDEGSSAVISKGVCWSTSENPTILDSTTNEGGGTGSFVSHLTGLTQNRLYHVRAYATNSDETAYGESVSFTTNQWGTPTVASTTAVVGVTSSTASSGGNVTSDNGTAVTVRGVCWGTSHNPTTADSKTTDGGGTGAFTSTLTGLACGTTYYVRAYATNSVGTSYGNEVTFSTSSTLPSSVTITASSYAVMPSTTVTFTAPVETANYQWKVNNIHVGTNSTTYAYAPSNNDNIVCVLSSTLPGCSATVNSNTVNMIVYSTGTPCSPATVDHGGMTYNTVRIGLQCWLRENINLGARINTSGDQTNNSTVEKYCYGNNSNHCNVYGGLYQWAEAVQYLNGVTNTTHWNPQPTNVQGVCPTGWHIPTTTEVSTLVATLGGIGAAGAAMKEEGFAHWSEPNSGATNAWGFTALPSGDVYNHFSEYLSMYGRHWTPNMGTLANAARNFGPAYNLTGLLSGENFKTTALSVRCLKD